MRPSQPLRSRGQDLATQPKKPANNEGDCTVKPELTATSEQWPPVYNDPYFGVPWVVFAHTCLEAFSSQQIPSAPPKAPNTRVLRGQLLGQRNNYYIFSPQNLTLKPHFWIQGVWQAFKNQVRSRLQPKKSELKKIPHSGDKNVSK